MEALLSAMRQVGVIPDSFLCEYGRQRFEVTSAPVAGVRAADEAVITRELAHAVAFRLGSRVSFNPIPEPSGTGNGTHIHFSFLNDDLEPVLYEEKRPWHLPPWAVISSPVFSITCGLCAITTPSVASYFRLRPHRWAPVLADVKPLDRGAALASVRGRQRSQGSRPAIQCGVSRGRCDREPLPRAGRDGAGKGSTAFAGSGRSRSIIPGRCRKASPRH